MTIIKTPDQWGYTFTCDLVQCELQYQVGANDLKGAAHIFVTQNKRARVNLNTGEVHCGNSQYHPSAARRPKQ